MLHQLMDPRGEFLENYRCADGFQKINTSTKSVYVRQLSNKLVIKKTFSNTLVVSVIRLFAILVLMKKFCFGKYNVTFWYSSSRRRTI